MSRFRRHKKDHCGRALHADNHIDLHESRLCPYEAQTQQCIFNRTNLSLFSLSRLLFCSSPSPFCTVFTPASPSCSLATLLSHVLRLWFSHFDIQTVSIKYAPASLLCHYSTWECCFEFERVSRKTLKTSILINPQYLNMDLKYKETDHIL